MTWCLEQHSSTGNHHCHSYHPCTNLSDHFHEVNPPSPPPEYESISSATVLGEAIQTEKREGSTWMVNGEERRIEKGEKERQREEMTSEKGVQTYTERTTTPPPPSKGTGNSLLRIREKVMDWVAQRKERQAQRNQEQRMKRVCDRYEKQKARNEHMTGYSEGEPDGEHMCEQAEQIWKQEEQQEWKQRERKQQKGHAL